MHNSDQDYRLRQKLLQIHLKFLLAMSGLQQASQVMSLRFCKLGLRV